MTFGYKINRLGFLNLLSLTILVSLYFKFIRNSSMSPNSPVVIIGTGLAGMTSTLLLADKGIPVILVDKAGFPGGNSIKASSGINGVPTRYQPVLGDSIDLFIKDTIKSGKNACNEKLVQILASSSKNAINWLTKQGINLQAVSQLGGHSMPRTHRGEDGLAPGYSMISKLWAKIQQHPKVSLMMNTRLQKIISDGHEVTAIQVQTSDNSFETIDVKELIVATGGFAADTKSVDSLIKKYRPDLLDMPTTNAETISGDGQKIVSRDCNAKLMDMDVIQINPTGFVDFSNDKVNARNKFLCGELLRGIGGILVSLNSSKRFVDELQTRDVVTEAIIKHCTLPESDLTIGQKAMSLLIIDSSDYFKAKSHIDFYLSKNLLREGNADDIAAFAKSINPNFDVNTLISSFVTYNQGMLSKDQFGRSVFGSPLVSTKLFFGVTTPVLHFSMGGVTINEHGQAINNDDEPIKNLYTIGEISAGVHGKNRLGGNSLLECVVFAKQATDHILQKN